MIVGMDFGTTNSGMAAYDGRDLRLLPIDPSSPNPHVARTALYVTNQKRVFIGRGAVETYYAQNLNRKVRFERVWVGEVVMSFAELPDWVRDVYIDKDVLSPGRLFLSFKTGLSSPSYVGTTVGSEFYFIEDIVALYLYVARRRAERLLGQDVTRIVLGRPVRFSTDPQMDALAQGRLLRAAFRAGYDEIFLQPEPIAAAYFYETTIRHPENVLIFDFGGGTLDISIARLGEPGRRAILATGGIPIAGDVFDRKLVRAKLPRHFGEETTYRAEDGSTRPVPGHYFEAFSHWQNMLELNTPHELDTLDRIAEAATHRRRIRALIGLISSSYGLKMFDEVERVKRELSGALSGLIRLAGPGFDVTQLVTRAEFERLIEEDRAAIGTLLDNVLRDAQLRPGQIDAVIRTGGSSQIPAFIALLQERFGPERVRSIDTFSSVTSGLGVIGHHIERGELDVTPHRRAEGAGDEGGRFRPQAGRPSAAPPINLAIVKKFVDLQESEPGEDAPRLGLVALVEGEPRAVLFPAGDGAIVRLDGTPLAGLAPGAVLIAPAGERVLLMTSEYRFLLKTVGELADMTAMGLRLADTDTLYIDRFGVETVVALARWSALQAAPYLVFVSDAGYGRRLRAETVLPRFEAVEPFRLERLPGYPAGLAPLDEGAALILASSAGNVLRLNPAAVDLTDSRLMRVAGEGRVIGLACASDEAGLVVANGKGRGKRLRVGMLVEGTPGAAGQKVLARDMRGVTFAERGAAAWAITSRRIARLDLDGLWSGEGNGSDLRALLRLAKGETLAGLASLPPDDEPIEPVARLDRARA